MALYGVVMRWFYIRISEYDIKLIDVTVYRQDMISLCHDNMRTSNINVMIWFCNVQILLFIIVNDVMMSGYSFINAGYGG